MNWGWIETRKTVNSYLTWLLRRLTFPSSVLKCYLVLVEWHRYLFYPPTANCQLSTAVKIFKKNLIIKMDLLYNWKHKKHTLCHSVTGYGWMFFKCNELALLNSEKAVIVKASRADYYWRTGLTVMVSLGQHEISTHSHGTRLMISSTKDNGPPPQPRKRPRLSGSQRITDNAGLDWPSWWLYRRRIRVASCLQRKGGGEGWYGSERMSKLGASWIFEN